MMEKKSRFIANCIPVYSIEEAENFINQIKKTHHTATHNVFAYRVFAENKIAERQSDDGEPSGTAGFPILNVLRGEDIVNAAAVVTRYYGGVLLGTGGLARAYSGSAKEGITVAGIIEKILYQTLFVKVDNTLLGKVRYETLQREHIIDDTIYTDVVEFKILVKIPEVEVFVKAIINTTAGNAAVVYGELSYLNSQPQY